MNNQDQLSYFLNLLNTLKENENTVLVDDYGISFNFGKGQDIDLLLIGLIHGDEVIGIEIINNILEKISSGSVNLHINFTILLGNIKAYEKNVRYLEYDMNRCFGYSDSDHYEIKRALQIQNFVKKSKAVFDIHQTIGPSISPFFIFPFNLLSTQIASYLFPKIPILTFSGPAFSKNGKTLIEYAVEQNCLVLSMECGQKGFNSNMASKIEEVILKFIDYLTSGQMLNVSGEYIIHQIDRTLYCSEGDSLVPGLQSCCPVALGEVIGTRANGDLIKSPFDGFIYFPKYGELTVITGVMCELAVEKMIKTESF